MARVQVDARRELRAVQCESVEHLGHRHGPLHGGREHVQGVLWWNAAVYGCDGGLLRQRREARLLDPIVDEPSNASGDLRDFAQLALGFE